MLDHCDTAYWTILCVSYSSVVVFTDAVCLVAVFARVVHYTVLAFSGPFLYNFPNSTRRSSPKTCRHVSPGGNSIGAIRFPFSSIIAYSGGKEQPSPVSLSLLLLISSLLPWLYARTGISLEGSGATYAVSLLSFPAAISIFFSLRQEWTLGEITDSLFRAY
jgi:hypothetical protein